MTLLPQTGTKKKSLLYGWEDNKSLEFGTFCFFFAEVLSVKTKSQQNLSHKNTLILTLNWDKIYGGRWKWPENHRKLLKWHSDKSHSLNVWNSFLSGQFFIIFHKKASIKKYDVRNGKTFLISIFSLDLFQFLSSSSCYETPFCTFTFETHLDYCS